MPASPATADSPATSGASRFRYHWRLKQTGTQVEGTIHLASQDGTSYAFYAMQGIVERDRLVFAGTNFIDIAWKIDKRTNRIVVMSAIDNVVKGASGQAVQCMNLMLGLPETAGLI